MRRPTPLDGTTTERADRPRGVSRRLVLAGAPVVLLPLLAACGAAPQAPAPTPKPAAPSGPARESTPKAGITVADLAHRIASGWADVKSYRYSVTSPMLLPAASPVPGTPGTIPMATPGAATPIARSVVKTDVTSVLEVVLPDRKHGTVTGTGVADVEAILVGPTMVARGPAIPLLGLGPSASEWTLVDPARLDPANPTAGPLLSLYTPIVGVPVAFPERLFEQVVRPLGAITVDGTPCEGYAIADTNLRGTRLDLTLALDDRNRPRLLETKIKTEVQQRTTWDEFNAVPPIEIPAGIVLPATPFAMPAATPVAD